MSKIKVGIAERNMLRAVFTVLSGTGNITTEDVVEIAAFTEALSLESAEDTVRKLEQQIQYARMLAQRELRSVAKKIERAEKNEEEIPADLYSAYDAQLQKVDDLPAALSYSMLLDKADEVEYEIDKSSVNWLDNILKEYKWNQTLSRDPQGHVDAVKRTLNPDEARVAASLVRAVKKAL